MSDTTSIDRNGLLCLRTSPMPISALLDGFGTIAVPQFQRAYSWTEHQVNAFIRDIELSRAARAEGEPKPHFFGAIVSSVSSVPGTSRPHIILIDGQQRIVTIYILLCELITHFKSAKSVADVAGDASLARVFEERALVLRTNFEYLRDVEFVDAKEFRKISLCDADRDFFEDLLSGAGPVETRNSHKLLSNAVSAIRSYLGGLVERAVTPLEFQITLDSLYMTFVKDLSIVHLSSDDRSHANKMFRVLNARGIAVTEGELLRARTLEAVAVRLPKEKVDALSKIWDDILSGNEMEPDLAISVIFQSLTGQPPSIGEIDLEFEKVFFPKLEGYRTLTTDEASDVENCIKSLHKEVNALNLLADGKPPFTDDSGMDAVSLSRLEALIKSLKQDYCCLPLLLAARHIGKPKFANTADIVERFLFRYAVIAKGPIYLVNNIFNLQAIKMRAEGVAYSTRDLVDQLQSILPIHADEATFEQGLRSLQYRQNANPAIRYLLIMNEHMFRWHNEGAASKPVCRDVARVLDFDAMTIEHIYAQNADEPDPILAPTVNNIGNLTIVSEAENGKLGSKNFTLKKPIFAASTYHLNREIAVNEVWNEDTNINRTDRLIERTLSIFRV